MQSIFKNKISASFIFILFIGLIFIFKKYLPFPIHEKIDVNENISKQFKYEQYYQENSNFNFQYFGNIKQGLIKQNKNLHETQLSIYFKGKNEENKEEENELNFFENSLSQYLFWLSYGQRNSKLFLFGQYFCKYYEFKYQSLVNICNHLPTLVYSIAPALKENCFNVTDFNVKEPEKTNVLNWMDLAAVIFFCFFCHLVLFCLFFFLKSQ